MAEHRDSRRRYPAALRAPWRARDTDPEADLEELRALRGGGACQPPGRRRWARRPGWRRGLRWLAIALAGWIGLSVVLFVISSIVAPGIGNVALAGGGVPPFSATTILVLGSDQRPKGSHEPGAATSGPSRSDVMLLIRAGGGHSARLSIPRDMVVQIPGHGTGKINAAFAYGGATLAVATVEGFLGIKVNHVVEIDFTHFPQLIDAMGGVDFETRVCIVSRINGGFRNGGYTLRLRPGTHHLSGKQALALSRTRHNDCHPGESDLTREMRQQQLFTSMKSRLLSVSSFFRLPWIAWAAPQTLRSDMGPFTLLGLFAAIETAGSPKTRILEPDGTATLPDGEVGLTVSLASKEAAVHRFLSG